MPLFLTRVNRPWTSSKLVKTATYYRPGQMLTVENVWRQFPNRRNNPTLYGYVGDVKLEVDVFGLSKYTRTNFQAPSTL